MANLKIELQLDLTPFKEGLKSALRLGENFSSQFQDMLSGVKVEADLSELDSIADEAEAAISGIEGEATITGDGSQAEQEVEDVKAAIESIPDEKTLTINAEGDALDTLGNLSLIYTGLTQAVGQVSGALSGLTDKSNIQEDAEYSLRAALRNTGLEVDNNFAKLKNYAAGFQEVTRYGDEAIISGTALAQNVGKFADEDLPRVQKAAIGLASTYRIDLQTAFQLIGRAGAGQMQMLTRYGIVIDTTKSKEEQFQQVLEKGVEGLEIAKEMAEAESGQMEQLGNTFGDLQEKVGDLMKLGFGPFIPILKSAAEIAGDFILSLTESPLERTIRQLEDVGVAAEKISKLRKLQMTVELYEMQRQLKRTNTEFETQEDIMSEIEKIQQELGVGLDDQQKKEKTISDIIRENGLIQKYFSDVYIGNEETRQSLVAQAYELEREQNIKRFNDLSAQLELMQNIEVTEKQILALSEDVNENTEDTDIDIELTPPTPAEIVAVLREIQDDLDSKKVVVDVDFDVDGFIDQLEDAEKAQQDFRENIIDTAGMAADAWGSYYDLQSTNLDNEYEERKEAIENSAKSEEDKKKALEKLDEEFAEKQKELAEEQKPMKIAQATSNVALGITRAFADPGGVLGWIMSGLIAAQGALQIATIKAEKYADGIVEIEGPGSDRSDSILAFLSRGESVINAEATRKNRSALSYINEGGVLPGFADGEVSVGTGGGSYVSMRDVKEQNTLLKENAKYLKMIADNTDKMRKSARRF